MLPCAQDRRDAFARLRQRLDARCQSGGRTGMEPLLPTGLPGVDGLLGGGLPRGALSELVFSARSSGGQLLLVHLLHAARRSHRFLALVDGADGFDPQTIEPPTLLHHLLWVRCSGAAQAMQAADLIARDSNFALLALDLRGCEARDLRRVPSTTWYRLHRVVEPTDMVLAVLTPRHLVPAARIRLAFHRPLPLTALAMEQADIAEQLAPEVDRLKGSGFNTQPEVVTGTRGGSRSQPPLTLVPETVDDDREAYTFAAG